LIRFRRQQLKRNLPLISRSLKLPYSGKLPRPDSDLFQLLCW
jgi:hypothetical protein